MSILRFVYVFAIFSVIF